MVRELDLRLLATPTVEIANIGLGNLSHLNDSERNVVHSLASIAHRRKLASESKAMPDGSFPIPDVPHLKKAIQAYGRAKNKPRVKRFIVRRARGLGRTDLLPEAWGVQVAPATVMADGGGDGIQNGIMVAIYPPPDVAHSLAGDQDGDLTPDDMHVTLAYLGTTDDVTSEQLDAARQVIGNVANGASPFDAQVQGVGTFDSPESDDPHWYSVDAPGLAALRTGIVQALESVGVQPRVEHDFTPHMTVRYGGDQPEIPENTDPWPVNGLVFAVGGRHEVYGFGHDYLPDESNEGDDDCLLCGSGPDTPAHHSEPVPAWMDAQDNPALAGQINEMVGADGETVEFVAAPGPCSLDRSPKHNWVESHGGLPNYICQVARAVAHGGKSLESAIPIAIGTMKHWAAGGTHDGKKVSAAVQARAAEALSEWEKMKAAAHGGHSATTAEFDSIDGPSALDMEFMTVTGPATSGRLYTKVGSQYQEPPQKAKTSRTYKRKPKGVGGGQFAPTGATKRKSSSTKTAQNKAARAKTAAAKKAAAANKRQSAVAKAKAAAAARTKAAALKAAIAQARGNAKGQPGVAVTSKSGGWNPSLPGATPLTPRQVSRQQRQNIATARSVQKGTSPVISIPGVSGSPPKTPSNNPAKNASSGATPTSTTSKTAATAARPTGPSTQPPGQSSGLVAKNKGFATVAQEFAWNPDIHPADKHGRPIAKGHKVKPPAGEPGTVVGNAPARGKAVVQINQGKGATLSVPAADSEVVSPPESPASLNDMELKNRHAKISGHIAEKLSKQADAAKRLADDPSATPPDPEDDAELQRLNAKRQPYADEIAKRSGATSGGNVTASVTASAADDPALGDFTYYWDPETEETFRVGQDGDVSVFAPAVDEQEQATWQALDLSDGALDADDVRRLPEIDDHATLSAILGASMVASAGEVTETPEAPAEEAAAAQPQDTGGRRFRIPVLIPEGVPSGDRRQFAEGALEAKEPPIQLLWQRATDEGHKGSVIVGRIDKIERLESGGLGNAEGQFDTHADAIEAARQVRERYLTGVSGDVDQFESELSQDTDSGEDRLLIKHGRLVAATLVAKPAFQEATIEMVPEEGDVPVITASAGPLLPPKSWFFKPSLDGPTMLTVDDGGRVFGHIAEWGTPHLGNPQLKPPRSSTKYRYFNRKPLRTAEGEEVKVGQLTLVGGHAKMSYDPDRAVKHYDDTRSAVADVVAGEDEFGIWVAGAMRPDVSPEQVRAFRASEPSGDWRMRDGNLELCAICQVNVAGFPVTPRALVASGEVVSLVAAGMVGHETKRQSMSEVVAELQSEVAILKAERDSERRAALLETVESLRK